MLAPSSYKTYWALRGVGGGRWKGGGVTYQVKQALNLHKHTHTPSHPTANLPTTHKHRGKGEWEGR